MADLVVRLSGEDGLSPTLQKVKKELTEVGGSSSKLDVIKQKFDRIQGSTAPLNKKLKDVKKLLAEMNMEGLTNTEDFSIMAQQAGVYADALADASTAVKQFANDNMNLQAAVEGMTLVASTASVATGAMNLFGIENENVNEAILKVQSALAVLNGLQAISNVLNKDSALMLKLQALATTGATVTTTSFSAALTKNAIVEALATAKTKISTIAQTAWNVAKAIGMAMLGNFTGLALLAVGAVVGLCMATKDDTKATEENNESKEKLATTTEYLKDKQVEASQKINEEAGKLIANYKGLQVQWNNLSGDIEKAKWIEENKNKFQQLGFEIETVSDAEDFFNKSSSAVIEALKKRAKAAAMYQLYLEALQKQYELNNQKTVSYEWTYEGEVGGKDYNDKKQKAYQAALDKLNNDRKNQNAYVAQLERDMLDAQNEANEAALAVDKFKPKDKPKGKNGGGNNNKQVLNPKDDNKTLKFAQDMVNQLQDQLKNIPITATAELDQAKKQLSAWEKEVEYRKLIITPEVGLPEGSLEYAKDMQSKAQKALESVDLNLISPEDLQLALKQVDDWTKEVEKREIKLGIKTTVAEGSLDYAKNMLSQVEAEFNALDLSIVSDEDLRKAKQKIDHWVDEVNKREIKLGIAESVATIQGPTENKQFSKGSLEDKRQSLQNANSVIEQTKTDLKLGLISREEAQKAIDDVNAKLREIGLEPLDLHIEDDGSIMSTLEQIEERANNIGETTGYIDQLGQAFNTLGSSIGGATGSIISFGGQVISQGAQMVGQLAQIIAANQAAALAKGIQSGAGLQFPFNLAAIAVIVGTIASLFSSLPKFEAGGIIGGSSYSGDKLLARVNSGEMILNKTQQGNLYNAIRSNNIGGNGGMNGNVQFRISGRDLVGVINNQNSKMSKL